MRVSNAGAEAFKLEYLARTLKLFAMGSPLAGSSAYTIKVATKVKNGFQQPTHKEIFDKEPVAIDEEWSDWLFQFSHWIKIASKLSKKTKKLKGTDIQFSPRNKLLRAIPILLPPMPIVPMLKDVPEDDPVQDELRLLAKQLIAVIGGL